MSLYLQGRRAQSHRCVNHAAAVPCVSSNRHNNFWKRHCDDIEKTSLGIFSHWKQREKKIVFFTTREGELCRSLRQSCSLRWEGCEMSSRGSSSRLTSTLLEPWIWILLKSFAAQSYNFKQACTIVQKLIRFFLFFSHAGWENLKIGFCCIVLHPRFFSSLCLLYCKLSHIHTQLFFIAGISIHPPTSANVSISLDLKNTPSLSVRLHLGAAGILLWHTHWVEAVGRSCPCYAFEANNRCFDAGYC